MRRQARISAGGAHVVRSASALEVWLWLLIFIFQNEFRISRSIQPGYLDFDNLPETNFTCTGKVIGGYYADLETSCQMFHVCTVGQQEEPMDIKFLCLNGTVFDQETRVCERVDEVDCTKSEKFYSLNLELYGSTVPPIIQTDSPKTQTQSTEQSVQKVKPNHEGETDPSIDESSTTIHEKPQEQMTDIIDSTEDPVQEIKKDDYKNPQHYSPTHPSFPDEGAEEYDDGDGDNGEYEDDYSHSPTTTTPQPPSSTISTTTTTTTRAPLTSTITQLTSPHRLSHIPQGISSPSPITSSISSLGGSSSASSASSSPSIDPALLSPQDFIYRHRSPGSEAISFQSFRPADGVYITHAPPQQYDHFQYESSRTAPRPVQTRPAPFVQRPQPAPFRPTTLDPRDQLLRPGPTSQSSERHETSVKHRPQVYPSVLPAQRPLPFNPYYYERKRSDDAVSENESSLAARSVAPVTVTERPPLKPKSPPRVIVTASASVSDSNGKRLNYTVGNVVSAVKPIVAINYDDYKESDLIFDPFFLDVPKLQKRRKTRSSKNIKTFTFAATATTSPKLTTENISKKQETTTASKKYTAEATSTSVAWNPNDYVDDNYEPHAYIPPGPPLAVLVTHDVNKFKKPDRKQKYDTAEKRSPFGNKSILGRVQESKPTMSALQTTSSQIESGSAAPPSPPPPSPAADAHSCATARSTHCRTRA